jgi:hypothetical protein
VIRTNDMLLVIGIGYHSTFFNQITYLFNSLGELLVQQSMIRLHVTKSGQDDEVVQGLS